MLSQFKRQADLFELTMDHTDLDVNRETVVSGLGYPTNSIPEHFGMMLDRVIANLGQHCDIRAAFRIVEVQRAANEPGLVVGGRMFRMDKIVTGQLKKAELAVVFVCTIGSSLEVWSKKLLAEGNFAEGYMVNAVASEAVECATERLHYYIEQHMSEAGLRITNRFSPGYCGWSVSEQRQLFSLLPENLCGITLTESALMLPVKSVSGVIGAGSKVKWVDYPCGICGRVECIYGASHSSRAVRNDRSTSTE